MSDTNRTACACNMRKKIAIGILGVLPEELCGVSDADLAEFMGWDKAGPNGEPVLAIRFCPWCSHPVAKEERITHVQFQDEDVGGIDEEGESWKNGYKDEDDSE